MMSVYVAWLGPKQWPQIHINQKYFQTKQQIPVSYINVLQFEPKTVQIFQVIASELEPVFH